MKLDLDALEDAARQSNVKLDGIDPFWLKPGQAAVVADLRTANDAVLALVPRARLADQLAASLREFAHPCDECGKLATQVEEIRDWGTEARCPSHLRKGVNDSALDYRHPHVVEALAAYRAEVE